MKESDTPSPPGELYEPDTPSPPGELPVEDKKEPVPDASRRS